MDETGYWLEKMKYVVKNLSEEAENIKKTHNKHKRETKRENILSSITVPVDERYIYQNTSIVFKTKKCTGNHHYHINFFTIFSIQCTGLQFLEEWG